MFGGSMKRWLAIAMLWPSLALADTFTVTDIRIAGAAARLRGYRIQPVAGQRRRSGRRGDDPPADPPAVSVRLLSRHPNGSATATCSSSPWSNARRSTRSRSKGNKSIKTDALLDGLGKQGLKEGEIFKQATLERVDLELERQYVAQGRYGATIDTNVEELPRNRVAIHIDVKEGKTSTIRHINVVGNSRSARPTCSMYSSSRHPSLLSFYQERRQVLEGETDGRPREARVVLQGPRLRQFDVESTQVSITPDKRHVYSR